MSDLPVLFRKLGNGELIALFPTLPGHASNRAMVAYTRSAKKTETEASIMRVTTEMPTEGNEDFVFEVQRAFPMDQLKIRRRITDDLNAARETARGVSATLIAAQSAA